MRARVAPTGLPPYSHSSFAHISQFGQRLVMALEAIEHSPFQHELSLLQGNPLRHRNARPHRRKQKCQSLPRVSPFPITQQTTLETTSDTKCRVTRYRLGYAIWPHTV